MNDFPRLIEHAFPLKQASLDSVREKYGPRGHISGFHLWPARRPLAASRVTLIAALLPDPSAEQKPEGMSDEAWQKEIVRRRHALCEMIGGRVVKRIERKKMPGGRVVEREKPDTEGGILQWKRETENIEVVERLKERIKSVYGRPPRMLDLFAGGGAIPFEAMRLGCDVTAVDINPVAWFILKCTLEYPQKFAGQKRPLPEFILHNDQFMRQFFQKAKGCGKAETSAALKRLHQRLKKEAKAGQEEQASLPFAAIDGSEDGDLQADLAWHVRAWGEWVLDRARPDLARYYPVYADFEPLKPGHKAYELQPMKLVPLKEDGTPDIDALNKDFTQDYLEDKRNPRWVAKPTVAYLWARTVQCKNCRATVPLLKTRWLCKKDKKRVVLTMNVEAASSPLSEAASRRLGDTRRDVASTCDEFIDFFDPAQPIGHVTGNLPHWRQEHVTYFVTFRLADSMPQEKLRQWTHEREAWLKAHPEPRDENTRREYWRLFPARFEKWLDAGCGECILAQPEVTSLVEGALRRFDGSRYSLDEHGIMPNHVHALVTPLGDCDLSSILHSWKSFTSHQINERLGRTGTVWQKEFFDHIVRGPDHLERIRQYIRDNPRRGYLAPFVEAASSPLSELASRRVEETRRDVASTIQFAVETNAPIKGGNAAQRREHDKRIGAGTMSRAGAKCPCCNAIMTMEDIRTEGKAGRLGTTATTVVVDGQKGKEYRLPTDHEIQMAAEAAERIDEVFAGIPFGVPRDPTPAGGGRGAGRAFSVQGYGLMRWCDLFAPRQLLSLGTLVRCVQLARHTSVDSSSEFSQALFAYLASSLDRLVDHLTTNATWYLPGENVKHTYVRYALPITWDYAEANPLFDGGGSWSSAIVNCSAALDHALLAGRGAPPPRAIRASATTLELDQPVDVIVTDPPYYDAIPYSDLMDLFYVWLRRSMYAANREFEFLETTPLSPKWDAERADGELVDDESRHNGDAQASRRIYEEGMFRSFQRCWSALADAGRLVVVFAHKQPDAWETLVSALIRAGFVVDASWPIQTENVTRSRARASAALASSLWLVCKRRPSSAAAGWDNKVLDEMRRRIRTRLRDYWDAGIRGPDFVWAATGPALEAYSKHPVVRKANQPNAVMTVSEFLTQVRRMVVDYIVGQVLSGQETGEADVAAADKLDEPTAYYLLHRNDFGLEDAPVGTVILYAVSCGLSDRELIDPWDLLVKVGGSSSGDEEEEPDADSDEPVEAADSGSKVRLKTWAQRKSKSMGYEAPGGRPVPLIDRVHRLMHLWKSGDMHKMDEYLDDCGLRRQELFKRLLQSLIELSQPGTDERSLLESLSNHIGVRGPVRETGQAVMTFANQRTDETED